MFSGKPFKDIKIIDLGILLTIWAVSVVVKARREILDGNDLNAIPNQIDCELEVLESEQHHASNGQSKTMVCILGCLLSHPVYYTLI